MDKPNMSHRARGTQFNARRLGEMCLNWSKFENMRKRFGETHLNECYLGETHPDGSKSGHINDGSNIYPYYLVFASLKG